MKVESINGARIKFVPKQANVYSQGIKREVYSSPGGSIEFEIDAVRVLPKWAEGSSIQYGVSVWDSSGYDSDNSELFDSYEDAVNYISSIEICPNCGEMYEDKLNGDLQPDEDGAFCPHCLQELG